MTHKEQIKISDNKIESNINQYKINRLKQKYQLFRVVI